jgi:glycosyltransferase involved in cell wall biosynthesis
VRVWTYLAANRGRVRRGLNFLSYFASAALAGSLIRDVDIVIATSPQFFAGWAGAPVSSVKGAPFVLEIRDLWPESITAVEALGKGAVVRALEGLERALYRRAHHIVTVGDGYKEQLVARGVPPQKVSIVTNGVDADLFAPQPVNPAVRARYGLPADAFVVVFAGTIGLASGLHVALDAAALLKAAGRDDVRFLLVGDGAVRPELEERARAEGLDAVAFAGLVPRGELPAILAAADACLVHFRRKDLFATILPSKLFEDAAMAKPILLGFAGHARRLVEEAGCGIPFEPENAPELVAAIDRLIADRGAAREMGERGRRHVLEHYDRRELARRYLQVLERVRSESPAP